MKKLLASLGLSTLLSLFLLYGQVTVRLNPASSPLSLAPNWMEAHLRFSLPNYPAWKKAHPDASALAALDWAVAEGLQLPPTEGTKDSLLKHPLLVLDKVGQRLQETFQIN